MIRKKKKKKKTLWPFGPVIIACHWPELARRLQIGGGPAGQCLLWRPELVVNIMKVYIERNRKEGRTEHYLFDNTTMYNTYL